MTNYSFGSFALVSFFVLGGDAIASDSPAPLKIKCPIEISSNERLVGYAFVGQVKHGVQQPIDLTIQNLTNEELVFGDPTTDCGCTKAEAKSKVLKPHGTIKVSVLVNPPKDPQSTKFRTTLRFNDAKQPEPVFTVTLMFEISNALAFKGDMVMVEVPDAGETYEFAVPLVRGEGIRAKDVEISVEALPFLRAEYQEELGRVLCSVLPKDVPSTAVSGSLVVRNRSTGDVHTVPCYLEKSGVVKVYPSVLRLSREGQGFAGTVLLKIASGEDERTGGGAVQAAVSVHAECPGFSVDTDVKPVGGGLLRVSLSFALIDADGETPSPTKIRLFCPQSSFKFSKWIVIAPVD